MRIPEGRRRFGINVRREPIAGLALEDALLSGGPPVAPAGGIGVGHGALFTLPVSVHRRDRIFVNRAGGDKGVVDAAR